MQQESVFESVNVITVGTFISGLTIM